MDETLAAWRERPLDEIIYLFLNARYEKVRQDGQIRGAAILTPALALQVQVSLAGSIQPTNGSF